VKVPLWCRARHRSNRRRSPRGARLHKSDTAGPSRPGRRLTNSCLNPNVRRGSARAPPEVRGSVCENRKLQENSSFWGARFVADLSAYLPNPRVSCLLALVVPAVAATCFTWRSVSALQRPNIASPVARPWTQASPVFAASACFASPDPGSGDGKPTGTADEAPQPAASRSMLSSQRCWRGSTRNS
jgi:hypothetical protein